MCSFTVEKMGLKGARERSLKGEERVRDFRQEMEKGWENRRVGEEREGRKIIWEMGGKLCSHATLHWNPSSFSSQPWDLRTSCRTSLSFGFLISRDHNNSKLLHSPVVAVRQNNNTECSVLRLTHGKYSNFSYHNDQHRFLLSHFTSTHEIFQSYLSANTWVLLSSQSSSLTN